MLKARNEERKKRGEKQQNVVAREKVAVLSKVRSNCVCRDGWKC